MQLKTVAKRFGIQQNGLQGASGGGVSQHHKLLKRFLTRPKDFTWDELRSLLGGFGFEEAPSGKTAGSRRRFVHAVHGPITLHKPHPSNNLKSYQVTQIIGFLKTEGLV